MKEIKLTQGYVSLVDDEDFEYLNQWKWQVLKKKYTQYAARTIYINGEQTAILMHRLIMELSDKRQIDHIDHNGLNNQKNNLRICTNGQNQMNKRACGNSKYLGVNVIYKRNKNKTYKYITSEIAFNKKRIHLGAFQTEEDAAMAYDKAAVLYHGEFANLNFK